MIESREELDPSGTRATVTYHIVPGQQARVAAFNINISGFDASVVKTKLQLQNSAPFTREALGSDTRLVRQELIDRGFLSPSLEDARVERDPDNNSITINLTGTVGPKVTVVVPPDLS